MRYINIYLAGAMACCDSFQEMNEWRRHVKDKIEVAIDSCNQYRGTDLIARVINPCDFYNFENPKHQSEFEVMKYDLARVRESDIIIASLHKINQSIGTAIELYEASERGIPVIGYDPCGEYKSAHSWVRCCITRVESSIDKAVDYLTEFYFW